MRSDVAKQSENTRTVTMLELAGHDRQLLRETNNPLTFLAGELGLNGFTGGSFLDALLAGRRGRSDR